MTHIDDPRIDSAELESGQGRGLVRSWRLWTTVGAVVVLAAAVVVVAILTGGRQVRDWVVRESTTPAGAMCDATLEEVFGGGS